MAKDEKWGWRYEQNWDGVGVVLPSWLEVTNKSISIVALWGTGNKTEVNNKTNRSNILILKCSGASVCVFLKFGRRHILKFTW
jgi:hypothetical protein